MVVFCLLHSPTAAPKQCTERQSALWHGDTPSKGEYLPQTQNSQGWNMGGVQDFSRYHGEKMQLEEETKIYHTASRNSSNEYKELCFVYLLWLQVFGWQEWEWRQTDHLIPAFKWKPWDLGLCPSPGHRTERLRSSATPCGCHPQGGTWELITKKHKVVKGELLKEDIYRRHMKVKQFIKI